MYRSLHDRPQNQLLFWSQAYAPRDRAPARHGRRRAARRYGRIAVVHGGGRLAGDSDGSRARARHRRAVGGVKP